MLLLRSSKEQGSPNKGLTIRIDKRYRKTKRERFQMKILSSKLYNEVKYGFSMFSGERICIIGEKTIENEDGKIVELYLYNILGYAAKNGKPFASIKENIDILEGGF
jgi:hypothetical protein